MPVYHVLGCQQTHTIPHRIHVVGLVVMAIPRADDHVFQIRIISTHGTRVVMGHVQQAVVEETNTAL